jgi:DNA modification methylase
MIAAHKSGRKARLIELDPKYVDVIVRRWQEYSGEPAERQLDGVSFESATQKVG